MSEEHPRRGGPAVGRLARETQHRQVGHADVHGRVAEPGEEHHAPEADPAFVALRRREQFHEVERAQLAQHDQAAGHEDQEHPRCGQVADACDEAVAADGHERHQCAQGQYGDAPGGIGGEGILKGRHLDVREGHTHGRGRDGDHRPGQEAEQNAVGQVVEDDQFAAADAFELVVEREPVAGGDGRGDVAPAQHGQQVPHQQAHQQVERTDPPCHEQRTDHELRACGVFARVHSPEGGGTFEGVRGNGLAFELVARVRGRSGGGGSGVVHGRDTTVRAPVGLIVRVAHVRARRLNGSHGVDQPESTRAYRRMRGFRRMQRLQTVVSLRPGGATGWGDREPRAAFGPAGGGLPVLPGSCCSQPGSGRSGGVVSPVETPPAWG
ncbi:MAG: hypothetical protein KatS3mg132_386 [Limisphaera sp.]|nr:MAG: hypothetical protein KatS3mg132_386 [Limisphaera sp.]